MKRYLLFGPANQTWTEKSCGDISRQGWHTFKCDFHCPMEAALTARALNFKWWQVVDTQTKEILEEKTE